MPHPAGFLTNWRTGKPPRSSTHLPKTITLTFHKFFRIPWSPFTNKDSKLKRLPRFHTEPGQFFTSISTHFNYCLIIILKNLICNWTYSTIIKQLAFRALQLHIYSLQILKVGIYTFSPLTYYVEICYYSVKYNSDCLLQKKKISYYNASRTVYDSMVGAISLPYKYKKEKMNQIKDQKTYEFPCHKKP